MSLIKLKTKIYARIDICFDLSRSIDLHQISTTLSKEKAIAGVTSGLIGLGEMVTWEAYHFGFKQRLSTKITAHNQPFHFCDEQVKGIFKYMKHDHFFEERNGFVVMTDEFAFGAPLGWLGIAAEKLFLTSYMKQLLQKRNAVIKDYAETEKWKKIL